MYRQYEEPAVILERLNDTIKLLAKRRKLGCDIEEEVDLRLEIADLEDRLRFAYADEYEEEY